MIQQSFCFPLFQPKGMSLLEVFAQAKAIGYAAVELWQPDENGSSFGDLCAAASRSNLRISSMCGHRSLQNGMNKRSNHARILAELENSMNLAVQHNIPNLITFSGDINPGQTDEDAREACAELLRKAAPIAERLAINLNMELLNSKINHPGYQCDRTTWGVDVCRRVNSSRVKLLYDIYHMQIMEGDVIRTIRDNLRYIGHMHTAGNPGRWDFDDVDLPQELNYRGICRAISDSGYTGFVGHEFTSRGDLMRALQTHFDVCAV